MSIDILKTVDESEHFEHYGRGHKDGGHSGRYPWGSGENGYQRSSDFVNRVNELRKEGLTDKEIALALGFKTKDGSPALSYFRDEYRRAGIDNRMRKVDEAEMYKAQGKTTSEIGRLMGINESSVRSLLNEKSKEKMNQAKKTADFLREEIQKKGMIDVGAGTEIFLDISPDKLKDALNILQNEGYNVYGMGIKQVTNPGKQSNTKVLTLPDVTYGDVYKNIGDIKSLEEYTSDDYGETFRKVQYPASIDSKRVGIRYAEEGGLAKDGVIELRRGVDDLTMGKAHYAQVRILVDGSHYLKGMAVYSDDLPDGIDIMFNTNKKVGTDKFKVLKEIKDDPENPFGAYFKAKGQTPYIDKDGNEKLSVVNKLKEEGEWDTMSKNLSQQFLSKQPLNLIKNQLNETYKGYVADYDEIMSLTNPTIKKQMLLDFANTCESAVVTLKAKAFPGQSTKVILPLEKISEKEIYAPTYENGTKVALVRYPHAGTFEIPVLTVNNKNISGRKLFGNLQDAVGINSKVAEQLSGADFDGDTAVVIPFSSKVKITSQPYLKGLNGFDPKREYGSDDEVKPYKVMKESYKQKQMGIVSNLITDMTLRGADEQEIVRAVKHSMVVIDAVKHKLDYSRSEKENGINELKKRYQIKYDADGNENGYGGASTLLSKRKQDVEVPERKGSGVIDPNTGKVSYKESGRTYPNKKGEIVKATSKEKLLLNIDDAYDKRVNSGTPQEGYYADYVNKMKAMANNARKEYKATGNLKYSPDSAKIYKEEVDSLNKKLKMAKANAPRERRAQAIANSVIKAKIQDNPDLKNDKKEIKKLSQIALENARDSVSASGRRTKIEITDKEWQAIQAGAISDSKLSDMFKYTEKEKLKERALPKATTSLSQAKINKIQSMLANGATYADIAKAVGCSTSTVSSYAN